MKPKLPILTFRVDDLESSLRFYRRLGLETKGIIGTHYESGTVAFFNLACCLKLASRPRESLAVNAGLPHQPPSETEPSIGHNVNSDHEVNTVVRGAAHAGATVPKPEQRTFYGNNRLTEAGCLAHDAAFVHHQHFGQGI